RKGNADRCPIKALPPRAGKPGEIPHFSVEYGSAFGVARHIPGMENKEYRLAGNSQVPERPRRTAGLGDRVGYRNLARKRAAARVRALGARRGHAVPVHPVQQRQEERGPALQDRRLYSPRRSRQEIQGAPENADAVLEERASAPAVVPGEAVPPASQR